MKKKVVYPLLTLMSLSFLAGCNNDGDTSSSDQTSSEDASSSESDSFSESSSSEESSSQNYTYRSEVSKEPTCEEDGVKSFICNEDSTRSYTEVIPALGHLYDVENLEFVWVDYESASVTTNCTRCDKSQNFDASITSQVIEEPTCTKSGEKDYTGVVHINGQDYSDVKKETLTSSHAYAKVEERTVSPTYSEDGILVERCSKCGDEKEETIAKQRENLDTYGEETNPYILSSLGDWNAFAEDAATNTFKGKFIEIASDIGTEEEPITALVNNYADGVKHEFAGTILGNGKTLYVNLSSRPVSRTALFAFASNATFKDLTISGEVNGTDYAVASAFVGDGSGKMVFDNCVNNATVQALDSASGFVGYPRGGCTLTISNSKNCGAIYAVNDIAGGFVGNGGDAKSITLDNCVNEGTISAKAHYLGSFVGKGTTNVTINENCQNAGHAYFRSDRKVDATGHYYSCIEEGCTEKCGWTEHHLSLVAEVPSTCTEQGVQEHYACEECDSRFLKVDDEYTLATDESLALPLKEHAYQLVDEVPSTCQTSGTKAHYVCQECHQTFLLSDGSYVPATSEDLALDKADHAYGSEYRSDATGHWKVCSSCGEESAHEAHVQDYPEATEEHGITCKVCGYEIAPAKTHEHVYGDVVPEVKPSYATEGTIAYVSCSGCNAKFNPDSHEEISSEQMAVLPQKDAEDQNYGTEENPYLIANSVDLKAFTEAVNSGTSFEGKVFEMTADITEAVDAIIGTSAHAFQGTFDGKGHSVELNIKATSANAGLFGYTSGAVIKNVVTKGSLETNVASKSNAAGALVGYAVNTTIENCVNYANILIHAGVGDVGGIVGFSQTIALSDCVNYGSIEAAADCKTAKYVGGIIGNINKGGATITNCVSGYETLPEGTEQPSITHMLSYAGGIVGGANAKLTLSGCTNYMGISSVVANNTGFGGIVGLVNSGATGTSISDSVNHGAIEASSSVGGIVGRLAPKSTTAPLTLTDCSSDGELVIGSSSASEDVGVVGVSGTSAKVPGILIGSSAGANNTYKIIHQ